MHLSICSVLALILPDWCDWIMMVVYSIMEGQHLYNKYGEVIIKGVRTMDCSRDSSIMIALWHNLGVHNGSWPGTGNDYAFSSWVECDFRGICRTFSLSLFNRVRKSDNWNAPKPQKWVYVWLHLQLSRYLKKARHSLVMSCIHVKAPKYSKKPLNVIMQHENDS